MRTMLKKYRWRWIGHVLRRPMNDIMRVSLRWTSKGKRKKSRPKTTVEAELKGINKTWGEIKKKDQDRGEWITPGATRTRGGTSLTFMMRKHLLKPRFQSRSLRNSIRLSYKNMFDTLIW